MTTEDNFKDNFVNAVADVLLMSAIKLMIASTPKTMEVSDDILLKANTVLGGYTFISANLNVEEKVLTLTDTDNELIFYKYEYGENERLIITPVSNEEEEPEDEEGTFDIKDNDMRTALVYISKLAIRKNAQRTSGGKPFEGYHYFTKREINHINKLWKIPKDDEYAIDGGYSFIDETPWNAEKYLKTGMIRCYAKGGIANPKYGWTQDHKKKLDVHHC